MDDDERDAMKDAVAKAHAEAVAAVYAAIVREASRTESEEGARNVLTLAKAIHQFAPTGWFAYAPNTRAIWTAGGDGLGGDDVPDE